jgi:uncharacterized protein
MHWVVYALDHEHGEERRDRTYGAHRSYLASPLPVRIVMSGPLLAENGSTRIGSLFIVEASDRAAVLAFNAADPFQTQGVWRQVQIHPFDKRVDNRASADGSKTA